MTKNKILLTIGCILIVCGIFKPNLTSLLSPSCPIQSNYVLDAPSDNDLLIKAKNIIDILQTSDDSTRPSDCLKLSSLYADMAILIELKDTEQIVNSTSAIREANILAGKMLRLNIKDKYPDLADSSKDLVIAAIGDNDVVLDDVSRARAVEAFRALSWAFYEGSK